MAGQLKNQLPGHHFLLTCTVPAEARDFFRHNQRLAYVVFFVATAEAIKTLAADPRSGPGDIPSFLGVLSPTGKISRRELRARIELAHGFELPVAELEPLPPQAPLLCRHCGATMHWYCSLIPQRGLIMAGRPAE